MNVMRGADLLLYASGFILFIVSICYHNYSENFWVTLAFYTAEAAFVGSVADWFAVTALFKKPWGLNIPHTELIHRDRELLIENAANTIQNELISINSIRVDLKNLDFTTIVLSFINDPQRRATTINNICSLILDTEKELDLKDFVQLMSEELKKALQGESLAYLVGKLTRKALDDGIIKQMVNLGLEKMIAYPHWEEEIQKFLRQEIGKIGKVLVDIDDAAACLASEFTIILEELRKEDSDMRQLLDNRIKYIVDNINCNQQWQKNIEQWKKDVLAKLDVVPFINDCFGQARESFINLIKDKKSEDTIVGQWIEERLVIFSQNLTKNQVRRDIYNKHIRVAVVSFINEERSLIGKVVTTALSSKSKDDMNKFVMEIAGEDLAWIRRNGTLVGAAIGAVVFLIGYYIIDPFLGPLVRLWVGVDFL